MYLSVFGEARTHLERFEKGVVYEETPVLERER